MSNRFIRSQDLIDAKALNANPVVIVGVGAVGSHLAPLLVKMGVENLVLIDFDVVSIENLGVQGFRELDIDKTKVMAVKEQLLEIRKDIDIQVYAEPYDKKMVPRDATVFLCVDCLKTRRQAGIDFRMSRWSLMLDVRMAAENFRLFCVTKDKIHDYMKSIPKESEAVQLPCTAKATIYCATMAASGLCTMFKQSVMENWVPWHWHLNMQILDCTY